MKHTRLNKCFLSILCVFLVAMLMTVYVPIFTNMSVDHPSNASGGTVVISDDAPVPLANGVSVRKPTAAGTSVFSNSSATIDYSNAAEGYVMIRYSGGSSKLKVQITKSGGKTYTYDLKSDGTYETFPFSAGDGRYSIAVFRNVSGTSYAQVLDGSVDVKLNNAMLPFLYPSQYVNFNAESNTIKKAEELAAGATTDLQVIESIYTFVITNITYDENKAATVKSGYLPVVDNILASGKGICFDYAAVMTAMLRAQQIPTRLEVGYVSGGAYHAWLSTYTTENGWVSKIHFDGKSWKMMDPTFASSGGSSDSIMKYIGTGSNYSVQYYY